MQLPESDFHDAQRLVLSVLLHAMGDALAGDEAAHAWLESAHTSRIAALLHLTNAPQSRTKDMPRDADNVRGIDQPNRAAGIESVAHFFKPPEREPRAAFDLECEQMDPIPNPPTFVFETNSDDVLTLFTGDQGSITHSIDYGGQPFEVRLIRTQIEANFGIVIFAECKDPEVIVSNNSRTMKVAMIELVQEQRDRCKAVLRLLDARKVRHDLQGDMDWAHGVGRNLAMHIWLQTKQAYLRTPSESNNQSRQVDYLERKIIDAVQAIRKEGMSPTDERVASRLPEGPKGKPYSREWVNKKRNAMRERGINDV